MEVGEGLNFIWQWLLTLLKIPINILLAPFYTLRFVFRTVIRLIPILYRWLFTWDIPKAVVVLLVSLVVIFYRQGMRPIEETENLYYKILFGNKKEEKKQTKEKVDDDWNDEKKEIEEKKEIDDAKKTLTKKEPISKKVIDLCYHYKSKIAYSTLHYGADVYGDNTYAKLYQHLKQNVGAFIETEDDEKEAIALFSNANHAFTAEYMLLFTSAMIKGNTIIPVTPKSIFTNAKDMDAFDGAPVKTQQELEDMEETNGSEDFVEKMNKMKIKYLIVNDHFANLFPMIEENVKKLKYLKTLIILDKPFLTIFDNKLPVRKMGNIELYSYEQFNKLGAYADDEDMNECISKTTMKNVVLTLYDDERHNWISYTHEELLDTLNKISRGIFAHAARRHIRSYFVPQANETVQTTFTIDKLFAKEMVTPSNSSEHVLFYDYIHDGQSKDLLNKILYTILLPCTTYVHIYYDIETVKGATSRKLPQDTNEAFPKLASILKVLEPTIIVSSKPDHFQKVLSFGQHYFIDQCDVINASIASWACRLYAHYNQLSFGHGLTENMLTNMQTSIAQSLVHRRYRKFLGLGECNLFLHLISTNDQEEMEPTFMNQCARLNIAYHFVAGKMDHALMGATSLYGVIPKSVNTNAMRQALDNVDFSSVQNWRSGSRFIKFSS